MATLLNYPFVVVHKGDGVLTVGFADSSFNTQEYLTLQRWVDDEGEDDEIHIERNGQQQGIYGGIERLVLSRQGARLLLNSETARTVGTQREIEIQFEVTDEQFQHLHASLERVFEGYGTLEIEL